MSDWQRVIDNCEMAGLDAPHDMFEVSECIDKLDDQIRKLKRENKKLKEQQANGLPDNHEQALPINGVSNRAEVISDIVKALKSDEPNYVFKDCPICKGKGYTHGYGTHSIEPDWCDECGGHGEIVDEDATHLVKLQIVSKVLKEHGY